MNEQYSHQVALLEQQRYQTTFEQYQRQLDMLNAYEVAYRRGEPLVSDRMFDSLYQSTFLLRDRLNLKDPLPDVFVLPSFRNETGLLLNIVSKTKHFHLRPMLSLGNIFNWEHVKNLVETPEWKNHHYEYKLDGVAVALTYANGHLVCASTRGDGRIGELINPVVFSNIPETIPFKGTVEIRGEGILPRLAPGDQLRNIAAGLVRRQFPDAKSLDFIAYGHAFDINDDDSNHHNWSDYQALYKDLKTWGFSCTSCLSLGDFRIDNPDRAVIIDGKTYDIDGIVIKVSDFESHTRMGEGTKYPHYACCYKFAALGEIVHFSNIAWQIGRTGVLTPVAYFDPVKINGVMITQASLHNLKFVMDNNASVDAMANIVRSGDVIPYVESIICEAPASPPENCPCCSTKTVHDDIFLYCPNPSCPEQNIQQLDFIFGKECLDVEGLGIETIRRFYDLGILRNAWDVFNLCNLKNVLTSLEGFGERSFQNLVAAIDASREVSFDTAVKILSIQDVGRSIGKKLEPLVNSDIYKLESLTHDELMAVHGIGSVTTNKILNFFSSPAWQLTKEHFLPELNIVGNVKVSNGPLSHLKICVTGRFEGETRSSIQDRLKALGATIVSNVTSETNVLICPVGFQSTKLTNAIKHGTTIVHDPRELETK